MIDNSIIEQLKSDVGEILAIELIHVFVDESQKLVAEMVHSSDAKTIEINAHSLKSSCNSFGATQLAQTCLQIEKTVNQEGVSSQLQQLLKVAESQSELTFKQLALVIKNP
ncbi:MULTISPECIES: Hpt domain-containing protein [unclassified Pseudoalteromonas]|uniref:Hpt domain-containing protein n=1 Tax=unclassified Pseudoalteromonas TaxID=194690 RepID=UPI000C08651F|nr:MULTISPECIES: Hpt domain-containing protein [unclassified Pseudoalteromonas]MDB2356500.1 Hpt domain-containing protein [Pseudoalteromonas sp.]MDP2636216.1 Hpt domain-containing protein [Pseudoalteromonas sp. 1_MG-2023]PHN89439.1 diguanylate cyclase [Pseudoalteromonas sp. 3D05]TGE85043.1 diguanylate cyclase [Pseudoalteromonas sp. KS88]